MLWQYTPYTIPLFLAGAFPSILALHVLRRRRSREALSISLVMLCMGAWAIFYGFQLSDATLAGQVFWNKIQYVAVAPLSVFWLVFCLEYSGRSTWISKKTLLLLLVVPVITVVLVWTNEHHGLIWKSFILERNGAVLTESSTNGPWVWFYTGYSYLLLLIGSLLVFRRLVDSKIRMYQGQAAALLFFILTPWLGNILFLIGIHPFPHLNITPFIFAVTCPVLAWGLFHFRLADLMPVAHAAVIESMNDGVIVFDEQNRIVEANAAAQRFLALEPSGYIGLHIQKLPFGFAQRLAMHESVAALEREITIDRNGRSCVYDIHLSPLLDRRGRLISRVIVMRDITDRKLAEAELQNHKDHLEDMVQQRTAELSKANENLLSEVTQRRRVEDALRESERKYKEIVENSNDVIMLIGADGICQYLSPSCREVTEFEPEELIGTMPWLAHPDDKPAVLRALTEALAGESGSDFEYRIFTKSRKLKWVSHSWSPIIDNGRLQMVVSSVRDITERKTFEEVLRKSEERYRMLVDNLLVGLCVHQDGIIKFVNKKLIALFGYAEEEIVGQHFEQFIYPDDRQMVNRVVSRRLSGRDLTGRYQFRGLKKNGEILWLESFGARVDFQEKEALLVNLNDITDRKRAETALKESEQRYRTLVEEARDIIYTIDLESKAITNANTYSGEILGYDRSEIVGSNYLDMVFPEDREMLSAALRERVPAKRGIPNFPFRMRKADGSALEVEQNGAIISDETGRPATYLGVARDVTQRKRMEEELRLSEERYRQILNSSHDIVVVIDDKANVLFVNQAFQLCFGDNRGLLGQPLSGVIHPEDRQTVQKWYQKLNAGESIRKAEYRIIDKEGEVKWMESNTDPIHWPGSEKAIVNIARDITDRKLAEEALRESEERYRTLVDNSLTAVFVVQDDRFIFINDRLCEMSGFTREEFLGMSFLSVLHPDDRERIEEIVNERLQHPGSRGQSQFRTIIKDGGIRWVETHGANIQFQGRPALLVNLLDITERKRMEEALRESEQKYRSLVEITSDWVWETDINGKFTYASPKVKELLGYEPEEVIGRFAFDFTTPEEAEDNREYLRQKAALKRAFAGMEKLNRHKNGRLVVLESSGVPFFDLEGRILGYRGIDRDITDRKRADEALRISEERYRSIFEEAPDIFFILDSESWAITDANKYALEALKYGPEVLGKITVSEIVHPDDYQELIGRVKEAARRRELLRDFPLRVLTATGEIHHIELRGVLLSENGGSRYFLGFARDVTERKIQEEMIRKRNAKLAALYEIAKAANASLEIDYVLKLVVDVILGLTHSEAACIYKYDEQRGVLTQQISAGFPDDFLKGATSLKLGEGLHGHVALSRTLLNVHNFPTDLLPQGRVRFKDVGFDSALIVPLLAREKLLGTLTVARKQNKAYDSEDLDLVTTIANQIVIAMENMNLYSQILQREAHLQSILQTSLDGIVVTGEDQTVVYRNSALTTMFGYSDFDDVSGTNTATYFADESQPVLKWLRQELHKGKPINRLVEFKARRKDGTLFDAEMRIDCFYENERRFDVGVIRDVTEGRRMQFQLLQSSKLAAIGELAAGVSHEINNPISAIDVQTGLMRDILSDERGKIDNRVRGQLEKSLGTIEKQVQRCHQVTKTLLTFSRFPESKQEPFDINKLLRETVQFFSHLSEKKPRVDLNLNERIPEFFGDPNRLEQVFVNLWNNAVKAVGEDGLIRISTDVNEGGDVRIEFSDSGVGIPHEIKDRIFDPFFTTRPEGEGTGLGLSISYYIIKEMGGTLHFDSYPGKGTTFTITLQGSNGAKEKLQNVP